MMNRLLILMIAVGLMIFGWNSWQLYASTGGVIQDKEKTQAISEDWDNTRFNEGYNENSESVENVDETDPEVASVNSNKLVEKEYNYEAGDEIGELFIPRLERIYEVYWGTDEDTLDQGVGYHDSDFTTPPDGLRHTVLSGHRDTVFQKLADLVEGDRLYVSFEEDVYEYQIREIWITNAEDRTVIIHKDKPTLTLTTCYPFEFLGAAPDRYIIQAELISINDK
ncbi:class D sortase [Salipaludibacillus sp. CF4.18]|uniref:class D sortase n=1 Tax=Salipaludibacillus sp. CF4.18 TaxID=3373081 RepID=UPI003EE54CED